MRELKRLVALSVALWISTIVGGCGGRGTLSNSAAPAPGPGTTTPTPTPSPTPPGAPSPTPTPTPSPTPGSTTISDIQKMSGWQVCTGSCTNTAVAVYSMTQGITSPALSGASQRFQLLAGTQPYGAALWFKYL